MKSVIADSRLDLELRKEPKQARARQTYEKILEATAVLLDEVGLDGVNTNLVAERADVNISAVYKYFPNKYAILSTLAVRLNDKQTEIVLDYVTKLAEPISWQDMMSGLIDTMIKGTRHEKGLIALQSAMLATPGLKEIYRKSNDDVAKVILKALEKCEISLPANKRKLIGSCIGEIVPTMLDFSVSKGKRYDSKIIEELKRMQIGYISTYLDGKYKI
ncbi:MAG: TetR/AcrR family transcriptional regulator [Gammaproteobacteria bacterium]|jgi:AcrR family transcriptional regulator|nr:TetR/AcrR family transcriptional regulator [Gammaproteobacteria bacterium]